MARWLLLCVLSVLASPWLAGTSAARYFTYSVNPGEGFNLRRDVYVRAAVLVQQLRHEQPDWLLVLPPWPHLHHWKSPFQQAHSSWNRFFDVEQLNTYTPVIEFNEYLRRKGPVVDEVLELQLLQEGIGGAGGLEERLEERPCSGLAERQRSLQLGREGVAVGSYRCAAAIGFASLLLPKLLQQKPNSSMLVRRMETLMHIDFGGVAYWEARRSMVYAAPLREEGSAFMREKLGYEAGDGVGRSVPQNGGGPFISVHLRRQDYVRARPQAVPSLPEVVRQLLALQRQHNLERVFLASDSPVEEKQLLQAQVPGLVFYVPQEGQLQKFGDGGIAIIDQWIAAHANYFVGSKSSTFSFRIREDRQFMGFSQQSTFNELCWQGDGLEQREGCSTPTYWKLVEKEQGQGHHHHWEL